jgi:hypothetical protein
VRKDVAVGEHSYYFLVELREEQMSLHVRKLRRHHNTPNENIF